MNFSKIGVGCILAVGSAIVFLGCATIMNGDMIPVPVMTTPSEAKVSVAGAEYKSPATVLVPRGKGDFKLRIEKEGYKPVDVMLMQSADAWLWGNVVFGGLIGLAVDFISGDAYDVEPELVNIELLPNINSLKLNDLGILKVLVYDFHSFPKEIQKKIIKHSQIHKERIKASKLRS